MRVIAGKAKGRPIKAPQGLSTRPTSDRVKEAIFSVLAANIPGSRVLDAFAGSGALGIEALSRGAQKAVFIEAKATTVRVLKENITRLGFDETSRVIIGDCQKIIANLKDKYQEGGFDLVFLDPPYNKNLLSKSLEALLKGDVLSPEAIIVIETSSKGVENIEVQGFKVIKDSKYGDTAVIYLARERSAGCG